MENMLRLAKISKLHFSRLPKHAMQHSSINKLCQSGQYVNNIEIFQPDKFIQSLSWIGIQFNKVTQVSHILHERFNKWDDV